MNFHDARRKLGRIFAILVFASIIIFVIALFLPEKQSLVPTIDGDGDGLDLKFVTIAVSILTFLVSAIGTASTIFLGWRADRRQTKEMMMKIEALETQLAAAHRRTPDENEPA